MRKLLVFTIYFSFSFFLINAQQTISQDTDERLYRKGLVAFQNQSYATSRALFSKYLDRKDGKYIPEARYHLAYSKLKSGDETGARELLDFIESDVNHPLAVSGYFVLGNHFFEEKDFNEALKYYSKTREIQLLVDEQEEWRFKQGYSYLMLNETDKAAQNFDKAIDYYGNYFNDASYYLGQLYYEEKDFNSALSVLEPIDKQQVSYSDEVTALIASIYFKQRNYKKLYAYVDERLTTSASGVNKTLNRLAGEAYFNEKQYNKAAQYLQRFVDLSRNKAEAEVYFKLAYSYFQIEENEKAIDYFKLAALEKGDLGQTSSFYLGQLYLRTKNLNYALSAFRKAMNSGSDPDMAEEAAFLVGKINYDRKAFAEAITDLGSFLEAYPDSRWKTEANELLAQSYLKTSNYDQAIAHLEQIPNKSTVLKKAYQKVTYQKGQLQFNDSKFREGAANFEKSVLYPVDEEIASHAFYLLGDSYSILGQPKKAEKAYQSSKRYKGSIWPTYADYGLGYIAYNEKNFAKAESYFSTFLKKIHEGNDYYHDAKLRLADSKYVLKKYDEAIRLYEEIKSRSSYARDYIFYQLGLAYNLKGDQQKARANFKSVLNQGESNYADNALFQLAQTYIESGKFDQAVPYLDQLISDYPNSQLAPYARSKRALSYFNLNQLEKAKEDYKHILRNNLTHPAANSALLGLQEVSKKGVSVPEFEEYMETYRQANPNDNSLEVIAFESAKANYYDQKYGEAITSLNEFIEKYPKSGFLEDAYYFLADAHYRSQNWQQAERYFNKVAEFENTAYLSRALDKRGKALIKLNNYQKAANNYRRLLRESASPKDRYSANEGLMNAYFLSGKGDSTLHFANQILENEWKPSNAEPAVWLVKGKVFLQKKNYDAALDELIKVINQSQNEMGAEAKYLMARIYFEKENYRLSLETLFDLNRNYATYNYWIGQSFLLIADNYLKMGELLQAEATLNSIIENAKNEEVVNKAKEKLNAVKAATKEVLVQDTVQSDSL